MKEYETIRGLAELLQASERTIRNKVKEFREVADPIDLIDERKFIRVRTVPFIEFWSSGRRA